MAERMKNEYTPDLVSPPGDTLRETLDTIGMSQAELARRTGKAAKTINEIIQGKAAITPATALQFERVLGIPARFWNNRERDYREVLARSQEASQLEGSVGWLSSFPVADMVRNDHIRSFADPLAQLQEILSFFGVSSKQQWEQVYLEPEVAFRKSPVFTGNPFAVSAWLRQGQVLGHQIATQPFDTLRFRKALRQIRPLTFESPEVFGPELEAICAGAGVAVVFVRELPKVPVSGATQWLTTDKALMQLSLRYKTNDQIWFTFFHEACHILRHPKKAIFLESGHGCDGVEEKEADRFAADLLVPPEQWRSFRAMDRRTAAVIQSFADSVGIAPGIVVGRLQHEKLLPWRTGLNSMKMRLAWVTK